VRFLVHSEVGRCVLLYSAARRAIGAREFVSLGFGVVGELWETR
jgi:hypothetical protein